MTNESKEQSIKGTKVLITPIIVDEDSEETENWSMFSLENIDQFYTDDEPEYAI